MARPRTPTTVLDARGAFTAHPERKRNNEPMPAADIGAAPEHLVGANLDTWNELVASAAPGVLTSSDRVIVEIAACLLAAYRVDPSEFQSAKLTILTRTLAQLGMTPCDRSKIGVTTDAPEKDTGLSRFQNR